MKKISAKLLPLRKSKKEIQQKLLSDKVVMDYTSEELEYLSTPLGKAFFTHAPYIVESEEDDNYDYTYSEEEEEEEEESDSTEPFEITEESVEETVIETPKKAHWKDRIKCDICGGIYTRSAVSAHRGTKKHQIYADANKKFLHLMHK